jgi:hypothetical protein
MADEIVNIEQEKNKELDKEKEKKEAWYSRVPTNAWFWAMGIDALMFMYMNANKMKLINMWWVILITGIILWIISTNTGLKKPKVLSPKEAMIAIKKRRDEMYIEEILPLRVTMKILPWYKLMFTDVKPLSYYWAVLKVDRDRREYGVAEVGAVGDTQGFVCFENLPMPFDAQEHYPNKTMVMSALEKYIKEKMPSSSLSNIMMGRRGTP